MQSRAWGGTSVRRCGVRSRRSPCGGCLSSGDQRGAGSGDRNPQGLYKNLESLMPSQTRQERSAGDRANSPPTSRFLLGGSAPAVPAHRRAPGTPVSPPGFRDRRPGSSQSAWGCVHVRARRAALLFVLGQGSRSPSACCLLGPISAHERPSARTLSVEPTCPHGLHLPTKLAPSSRHLSYRPLDFTLLVFFLKTTVNGWISQCSCLGLW